MRRIPLLLIAALLAACGAIAREPAPQAPLLTPQKSPNDARAYGYLVLPNRLRVLLVSDPAANKAAAAMAVGVGSTSEPDDRPGLAHFLEHMLFMGTEKYPDVDDYSRFLADNGGESNAYTAANRTVYFFDVKPDRLEPALDRFAQFFIAPRFDARYVEREKHAVNSEYLLKRKDDSRRVNAALKQAYNPKSPYARFSVGNLETPADRPGDKVRDDLLAFYRKHYSANLMGLVVIGREPLARLRSLVEQRFAAVPDRDARRYRPGPDEWILPPDRLPLQEQITPLKEMHQLSLVFPVPSARSHYREQPLYYLSNLVGDEGVGSLHALLHDKGWLNSLSAGGSDLDAIQGQFEITMGLTREGMRHIGEIEKAVFDYLQLLRERGIADWRYDEQQRITELDFRYAEKAPPASYAQALAGKLLHYPARDVIRGGEVLEHYDAGLIRRYLERLTPDNAFVVLVDPALETDRVERYYQVPYALRRPPDHLPELKQARGPRTAGLALPPPNPFVPEHPALKPLSKATPAPRPLLREPGLELWHQQDESFGVPRATIAIALNSPRAADSARDAVATTLYARLVEDQLNALTYPAELAGLSFAVSPTREGLEIQVFGYDEKLPLLLGKLLDAMREPALAPDRFAVQKERLRRELANRKLDHAYLQVFRALLRDVVTPSWSPRQRLAALASLTREQLVGHVASLFSTAEVKILVHGNLSADEARALTRQLRQRLLAHSHLAPQPEPRLRLPAAGESRVIRYPVDHPDSVFASLDLGAAASPAAHARWRLLAQLFKQPFFKRLRTEQQLGYVVIADAVDVRRHPGLLMLVQSSKVGVDELKKRVAAFSEGFADYLERLDDKDFAANKAGLIATLKRKDESLRQRSQRYFSDLTNRRYGFDFKRRIADEVEKLDRAGIIAFYRQHLLQAPRHVEALSPGTRFSAGE